MSERRSVILAPAAHNLAEVTRALEIAKAIRADFDILFLSYDSGKRSHWLIEREGFAIREMQPALTEARIQEWWAIDRGEKFGDMFPTDELIARVESEVALYQEVQPVAVLTGFCLSVPISTRLAKVPLVWVIQTTWLLEYVKRYGTWPDAVDYPSVRWLPDAFMDWLSRRIAKVTYWTLNKGFNKAARHFGLPPFSGSAFFEGDYNLFAEPPGFSGIPVPARLADRHRFIGPLIAHLPIDVPPEIKNMPRDLPIVYFAMGSSGAEQIVAHIIQTFAGQPYRVIAPVAPLMKRLKLEPPPNVLVTDWLPADKVNPMADITVSHGGIGTVMTACLSGTPVVGIPNGNPEQECNLDCLVRKGFGIRLRKQRLTAKMVIEAIDRQLRNNEARQNALAFQSELQQWNGPANAAAFMRETFL